MISVYRKQNNDGGFDVTLINNNAVDMPNGNPYETDGWERMDVESVMMLGWTHADYHKHPEYELRGRELILAPRR